MCFEREQLVKRGYVLIDEQLGQNRADSVELFGYVRRVMPQLAIKAFVKQNRIEKCLVVARDHLKAVRRVHVMLVLDQILQKTLNRDENKLTIKRTINEQKKAYIWRFVDQLSLCGKHLVSTRSRWVRLSLVELG